MRHGELWATPMRMSDDVGVATAEVVRAHLEGRVDDIPLVSLGRITIVSGETGADEVDAMEREAFRYYRASARSNADRTGARIDEPAARFRGG